AGYRVRAAPPAGPEPGAVRGRGRAVESDVVPVWRPGRTGRPAVDAGRGHGGVEPTVEPPVPAVDRPVTPLEVQLHVSILPARAPACSRDRKSTRLNSSHV